MSATHRILVSVFLLCGLLGGLPALAFPSADAAVPGPEDVALMKRCQTIADRPGLLAPRLCLGAHGLEALLPVPPMASRAKHAKLKREVDSHA